MIMDAKKLEVARRWLDMAKTEYENLVAVENAACGSVGLVAKYNAIGSNGGGLSDNTAKQALSRLRINEAYKRKMAWLDTIFDAYGWFMDTKVGDERKSPNRIIHDRIVARILHYKVFYGATMEEIGTKYLPAGKVMSRQHISKLYGETVERVAIIAEGRGLYG